MIDARFWLEAGAVTAVTLLVLLVVVRLVIASVKDDPGAP